MFVNKKTARLKMINVKCWIWVLFGLCAIEAVSAYSASQRDYNYLSHDAHQQHLQQQEQQQHRHQQQDALQAGTGSSQAEMNFHPLGDYFGGAAVSHESLGETSSFEPHSQYLSPELQGDGDRLQEVDEQQQSLHHHHNQHRQKGRLHQFEGEATIPRNLLVPKDILSLYTQYPFATTSNNDLSVENGISANTGNYADIDNIYKQDMPEGNYNVHKWDVNDDAIENGFWSWLNDDDIQKLNDGQKRNAFHANKRKKSRKRQAQFMPGISVGAMTNLGDFFDNLKNNLDFLEKGELSDEQLQLLDGQHPLNSLKKEISTSSGENDSWHNNGPHGTAAFIHAIRTYRPSSRIRNLISSVPEGYRGTNSHDPNYKWIGLGKRSYY